MPGLQELGMIRGALQGLTGTGKAATRYMQIQEARNQIERQKMLDKEQKKLRDSQIKLNEMKLESLAARTKREEDQEKLMNTAYSAYLKSRMDMSQTNTMQGTNIGFDAGKRYNIKMNMTNPPTYEINGRTYTEEQFNEMKRTGKLPFSNNTAPFLSSPPISRAAFQKRIENPDAYAREQRAEEDQYMQKTKFRQDQMDREAKLMKEKEEVEFKRWEREAKKQKFEDYLEEQSQKEVDSSNKELKYISEQIFKNFPKDINGNYTVTKENILATPELGQEFLDYIGYKEAITKTNKGFFSDTIEEISPESIPKVNSATIWKYLRNKVDAKKAQETPSFKEGETRTINGIIYTRNRQGQWTK